MRNISLTLCTSFAVTLSALTGFQAWADGSRGERGQRAAEMNRTSDRSGPSDHRGSAGSSNRNRDDNKGRHGKGRKVSGHKVGEDRDDDAHESGAHEHSPSRG